MPPPTAFLGKNLALDDQSTVHRAVLLDFRRVAGHLFQDVDGEHDVQRDETQLSLQLLMALIEFHDDRVVRPDRRVSSEDPLRHLGPFAGLHGLDPIARPLRERDDVFCQPPSPPLLRELLEMVHRLAIILDRDLDVGFDEVPCLREIPVSDAVALPDRASLRHVHLVEQVHLLQFVDVPIDRRLGRLQLRGELFDGPPLVEPAEQTLDEQPIRDRIPHGTGIRLRIVAFRDVSDLREEQERDIVNVLQRREGGVAHDDDLERQKEPLRFRNGDA